MAKHGLGDEQFRSMQVHLSSFRVCRTSMVNCYSAACRTIDLLTNDLAPSVIPPPLDHTHPQRRACQQ